MRRFPAESEPHAASWLAWPHNRDNWPDPATLAEAEAEMVGLLGAIARGERVELLVRDADERERVARRLGSLPATRLRIHQVPTDDAFLRDSGPSFVREDAGLVAIDWGFRAWGGKYPPWERDAAVAARVAALAGTRCERAELELEGGALETDGQGTLLATRRSILGPNRNPGRDADEVERALAKRLGIRRLIWIDAEPLPGDDTDAHIDTLLRFVAPARVVSQDPALGRQLRGVHDALGRGIEVIDLPAPPALLADGRPLPASYANFFVANACVVVPAFGGPADARALGLLGALFAPRRAVGVPCRALLRGLGGPHCLTQPQFAPAPADPC